MPPAIRWQTGDRSSRHVRHARLRAQADAPVHRLGARAEEALRLLSLPGENQGRAYYFRRIRVIGLAPDGDRRSWLDGFQRALEQQAASAVHAADPRAAAASAVFFRGRQEALEILLRRVVQRQAVREWFWTLVMRDSGFATPSPPVNVPAIVDALRAAPAEWVAVAAALFAPPPIDTVWLLSAIPESMALAWLRPMDCGNPLPPQTKTALSKAIQRAAAEALQAFGLESPRALWYAAMAVLHEFPSEMATGMLLPRARAVLEDLLPRVYFEDSHRRNNPRSALRSDKHLAHEIRALPAPPPRDAAEPQEFSVDGTGSPHLSTENVRIEPAEPWSLAGAPTQAAGLFFLLNVLARIGLPEAIASGVLPGSDFLPRLLLRLAAQVGVSPEDSIAVWLMSLLPREEAETASTVRELRRWAVAVRRWCWRNGRLAVREIVARPGLFTVNRADLDISLPLDAADVRIRRIGLDLDPGWLPWFGFVVRFHYSWRGSLDA